MVLIDTIAIAQMVLLEANGFVFLDLLFTSFSVVSSVEASKLAEVNVIIDGVTRKVVP